MNRLSFTFIVIILFTIIFTINNNSIILSKADEKTFSAKAVYVTETNNQIPLIKKNETKRLPIASMCKIMTLLIAFEKEYEGKISFDSEISISANASGMGGSQVYLKAGNRYKIDDLIKSIVIASANDACVAVAEYIAGSEKNFVQMMNQRAEELGMNNTLFSNCTGLPKPTQYSCAKDVSVMFNELIKFDKYFSYSTIRIDEIQHEDNRTTSITNTNKLVNKYNGCDGGKTGYTCEAGHCISLTAKRGATRFIAVIISAPDSKSRFNDAQAALDYCFANYINKIIIDKKEILDVKAKVNGGKINEVAVQPSKDVYKFSRINEDVEIETQFTPIKHIKAPIRKGDVVGKLALFADNKLYQEIDCVASEDIDKKIYFDYVSDVIKKWVI